MKAMCIPAMSMFVFAVLFGVNSRLRSEVAPFLLSGYRSASVLSNATAVCYENSNRRTAAAACSTGRTWFFGNSIALGFAAAGLFWQLKKLTNKQIKTRAHCTNFFRYLWWKNDAM